MRGRWTAYPGRADLVRSLAQCPFAGRCTGRSASMLPLNAVATSLASEEGRPIDTLGVKPVDPLTLSSKMSGVGIPLVLLLNLEQFGLAGR